jgi:hypothetical protein
MSTPSTNDIKDGVPEKKFPGGILNLNNVGGKLFVGGFICLVILCIIFSFVNKDLNVNIASIILAFIALIPFGVTYWFSNNRANVNTKLNEYNTRVVEKFTKLNDISNPFKSMGGKIKNQYRKSMIDMRTFNTNQKRKFLEVIDKNVENITKNIENIKIKLALLKTTNEERKELYDKLLTIRDDLAVEKGKADAANSSGESVSTETENEISNNATEIDKLVDKKSSQTDNNNTINLMANNDTEYKLIDNNKPYIWEGISYPVFESTNIADKSKKYFTADGSRVFSPEEYMHYEDQYKNANQGSTQQKIQNILDKSGIDNSRGNELTDQQQLAEQLKKGNLNAANRFNQTNDQKKSTDNSYRQTNTDLGISDFY